MKKKYSLETTFQSKVKQENEKENMWSLILLIFVIDNIPLILLGCIGCIAKFYFG